MKFSDIFVAISVIAIILIIIIPVPLPVLDLFLSLNLSLAILILLIALFNKEPLDFSVFPTLLLIATLFRLALNISTTRKILGNANGGKVIEAFGNFVIGSDVIVGFIIFVIIIVIQFVVITKGSERVSEVAARFTLDAMPGKQMAIDADLNSGLISEAQAKERRLKIQREADFYGAMDGASKFVKGDAIAGIVITVINIVAGLVIGVLNFQYSITQSLQVFTLLTVGDGLVSQIPALMISSATGVVVTRAASDSSLGTDVASQLFNDPRVMFILSGVLGLLMITPLPTPPLLVLSILFLFLGFTFRNQKIQDEMIDEEDEVVNDEEELKKPESIMPLLQIDPIGMEFGYGIIPLADPNQGGDLFDRLIMIRRQVALELGIIVPMIRLRDNIQLDSNQYSIKIKGDEVASGEVVFDHYLAMDSGAVEEPIEGIDTIEPAFGLPAKWINEETREKAEMFGYTVVDISSMLSTHLTEVIKKHAHEILTRQDVQKLIDNVREENSALIDELIPGILSLGDIQKVFSNLLKENCSIRNLVTILETLADYGSRVNDIDLLTEYVRQSLSRSITQEFFPSKSSQVVTLSAELENYLMESLQQSDTGTYLAVDPSTSQRIINNLVVEVQKLLEIGEQPIVITAPIIRLYFKRMTEATIPDLIVLSYNEIENDVEIQSIGTVNI